MNSITKWDPFKDWDPFRDLEDFQHRLGNFFNRSVARRGQENPTTSAWAPAVDILEDNREFLVKVELPEVKKEDVHVTIENGVLTVHGERRCETEEKNKRYHRCERSYGSFTRSFSLPEGADPASVRAEFRDGMLQVHINKSEKAKPKEIEVKVQ